MAEEQERSEQQDRYAQQMLDEAKARARDGSEILEQLSPDLPWEKMENLVGQKILVIEADEGYSQFSDDALRVTFATEDDIMARITSIYNVVNRKLRKMRSYLPAWVRVVKREGTQGRSYYDLE